MLLPFLMLLRHFSNRRLIPTLIVFGCVTSWPSIAPGKDMSGLYGPVLLQTWLPTVQKDVLGLRDEEIGDELLKDVEFEFPPVGNSAEPFEFRASASDRTIQIPVLSVKFLYDLIYAYVWLEENKFSTQPVLDYVNMIKYKKAAEGPEGRYPRPFEALGIPHDSSERPTSDTEVIRNHFDTFFQSAMLFIIAHEIGHIVHDHQGPATLEHEEEADAFSCLLLAKRRISPIGAMFFFWFSSLWVRNGADFKTPEDYQKWLTSEADHPMNGKRITMVGSELYSDPAAFFPGAAPSDERVRLTKEVGWRLALIGSKLDDLASNKELQQRASELEFSTLTVHHRVGEVN